MTRINPRMNGIDLLRFTCALAIVIWHYDYYFDDGAATYFPLFKDVLWPIQKHGGFAVQVFWALSGIIFTWKYSDLIYSRQVSVKDFFLLRLSRLYPLHFLTLLLVAGLQFYYFEKHQHWFVFQNNDLYHFVLNIFFASALGLERGSSFNGPVWSVSIEEVIYVLFFLCSLIFAKSLKKSLLLFALFMAGYFAWPTSLFADAFCMFFLGGLVYELFQKLSERMALLALAIALCFSTYFFFSSLPTPIWTRFVFTPTLILLALCGGNYINGPLWEKLGNLTYSSYLLHFPLQLFIVSVFDTLKLSRDFLNHPIAFVTHIGSVFVLAYFCFNHFENEMKLILRKRWKLCQM